MEAELGARLTEAAAARTALERTLTEAQSAHQHASERAAEDLASAASRQASLEERLAQETDRGTGLERQLSDALAAAATREADLVDRLKTETARRRQRFLKVISTYRQRAREQKARFEALITGERTSSDRQLRAKDEDIRQHQLEHETLRRLLGTTQDRLQRLQSTAEEERQGHERARLKSESELQRVSAEYDQIRQSFDQLQSAFQTLEQIAGEHAAERVRLEAVVAERDSQLSVQAERHRIAEQDAQDAFAELQGKLRQALDAGGAESARLQQEVETLRRELDATWTHAEGLRGVAERVPDLQTQLERSQNESAPAIRARPIRIVPVLAERRDHRRESLIRRTARMPARRRAAEHGFRRGRARQRRRSGLAARASADDAQGRDRRDPVEDLGGPPSRRPAAGARHPTGSIDIVAEDITGVHELEERLRQAQRMEAVGRLASEVAVTCDALLSDVARGAREWLAKVGGDDALRRHAERQLTDVTRAASFLRQLRTYGNEQVRALEPVSAQRVLRDLAPVLKRLVGDEIKLVLPKSAGSFNVDVEAERLERLLINVAGYARERMPSGGQVRIDLATTAVGRRFVARYSNVRPGDHVLITVTELPAAGESRGDSDRSCTDPPTSPESTSASLAT